ncbi:MAG: SAM hydrolase/SAM-dependent halogenase family protein [Actinomycetota bacterium]
MPRPIALLTDFGSGDAYAGIMKGVLLTRCPGAPLFDLTHDIAPQDVFGGAVVLASAVRYCPADTVFLAVVDPGVGSDRRGVCLESGGRCFVGPDNGLLWPAAAAFGEPAAYHLDRPEHWLPEPGATFHGRDVFAPVSAALAQGVPARQLGSRIMDPLPLVLPTPVKRSGRIHGEILHIDRFGNAVTNIRPSDVGGANQAFQLEVGDRFIYGPSKCYRVVCSGEPTIVLGSWGYFEVAIRDGDAALLLGLQRGGPVVVAFPPERTPADAA